MTGLFWQDAPKARKVKKEPEVKLIPPPVWLADDYLPGIEDARKFDVGLISDNELIQMANVANKAGFIFDIETYPNYVLIAFMHEETEKVLYFESFNDAGLDVLKLRWLLQNFTVIGFNSNYFDIPIANLILNACKNAQIKEAANLIIESEFRQDQVYQHFKIKPLDGIDHIDLISLVPKDTSLKLCGGRIHTKRMQDLPYPPDRVLNKDQVDVIRWYCINDLRTTLDLKRTLKEQLNLRVAMSQEYGLDLRSKSDAQIAEAVIGKEVSELNGYRARRPVIAPGTSYKYVVPRYLKYQSDLMKGVLEQVRNADFVVSESGKVLIPEALESLKITIGKSTYKLGNGGLHSTEESVFHKSTDSHILIDADVASFYPAIILNQGLFPQHLSKGFLTIYNSLVVGRLKAKREAARLKKEIASIENEIERLKGLL